jgi:hypothetical protein
LEECGLRVFENNVMKEIYGPKKDQVTVELRKLYKLPIQHECVKKEHVTHQSQNNSTGHPRTDSESIVMELYFCWRLTRTHVVVDIIQRATKLLLV